MITKILQEVKEEGIKKDKDIKVAKVKKEENKKGEEPTEKDLLLVKVGEMKERMLLGKGSST